MYMKGEAGVVATCLEVSIFFTVYFSVSCLNTQIQPVTRPVRSFCCFAMPPNASRNAKYPREVFARFTDSSLLSDSSILFVSCRVDTIVVHSSDETFFYSNLRCRICINFTRSSFSSLLLVNSEPSVGCLPLSESWMLLPCSHGVSLR